MWWCYNPTVFYWACLTRTYGQGVVHPVLLFMTKGEQEGSKASRQVSSYSQHRWWPPVPCHMLPSHINTSLHWDPSKVGSLVRKRRQSLPRGEPAAWRLWEARATNVCAVCCRWGKSFSQHCSKEREERATPQLCLACGPCFTVQKPHQEKLPFSLTEQGTVHGSLKFWLPKRNDAI